MQGYRGSSTNASLSRLSKGSQTRKGNATNRNEVCRASGGTRERIGSGACPGSAYSKSSAPLKVKNKEAAPSTESMRISSSRSIDTTRPSNAIPQQEKRELVQNKSVSSSFHFLKIRRASSGVITIAPPLLFPVLDYLSTKLDRAIQARDEAAKSRSPLPLPLPGLLSATNARARNYSARSAKRKRLSGSSASSRKRS
jgi:hypothetical protein